MRSLILLSLLVTLTFAQPDLVINIFRHGARGPDKSSVDPTWGDMYGQLTPIGQRQQYILGAALAKTYPSLLDQPFNRSKVYVRSSQSDRCLDSVISQLFGALQGQGAPLPNNYPADLAVPPFNPSIVQEILAGLSNQEAIPTGFVPVTINSVPTSDDTVCETPGTCPALFEDALTQLAAKESLDFWFNDLKGTRDTLKGFGFKVDSPFDLSAIGDALIADHFQNKTFPVDIPVGSELYINATFAGYWYLQIAEYSSTRQKQLLAVPIFEEAFSFLDFKANRTSQMQFVAISTHDTALLTVLSTLDIVNQTCLMANYKSTLAGESLPYPNCLYPPFAANIIMELYVNGTDPYLVLKYNDAVINLCGTPECPYDQFKALIKELTNGYTGADYKTICKNGEIHDFALIIKEIEKIFHDHNYEPISTDAENSVVELRDILDGI